MKRYTLLYIIGAFSLSAFSQSLHWKADFSAFFDNREYRSPYDQSQTIFAAYVTPELGIKWNKRNYLMTGISYRQDFGGEPFERRPEWVAYYQYDSKSFDAFAGIFSRKHLIGDYSTAFFSDSIFYCDPNLNGALFQYTNKHFEGEFFCDWNSAQSATKNEKFLLGTAGKFKYGAFIVGWQGYMYHHAGTFAGEYVIDNGMSHLYLGTDLRKHSPFDAMYLTAGVLTGHERERTGTSQWNTSPALYVRLNLEKWHVGIKNDLQYGKGKNRLQAQFGNRLYWNDPFYQSKIYNRTDIYWNIAVTKFLKASLNSIFHFDDKGGFNWQQMLTIRVELEKK